MNRSTSPNRAELVYVQSRGWLLGKLGWPCSWSPRRSSSGPLVAGRPNAMWVVGWLGWAALALLALGAVVRVAEAVWGTGCTAYVLAVRWCRSLHQSPRRREGSPLARAGVEAVSRCWRSSSSSHPRERGPTRRSCSTRRTSSRTPSAPSRRSNRDQRSRDDREPGQAAREHGSEHCQVQRSLDREALPRLLQLGQIVEQEQAIAYAMAEWTACSRALSRLPAGHRLGEGL